MASHEDPQEAAISLVTEAYRLWLTYETRTDDISAIVVMMDHLDQSASGYKTPSVIQPLAYLMLVGFSPGYAWHVSSPFRCSL